MTADEALKHVRGFAAAGRYVVSQHARKRMQERGVQEMDLRNALVNARSAEAKDDGKWKVEGSDLDGDDLTVIVVIDDGVIVVTLF